MFTTTKTVFQEITFAMFYTTKTVYAESVEAEKTAVVQTKKGKK